MYTEEIADILAAIEKVENRILYLSSEDEEIQTLAIQLFDIDSIDKGQVGCRVSKDGTLLFGKEDGEWQESWFVIGTVLGSDSQEDEPIFADVTDPQYPIFNGIKTAEKWEGFLLFSSLEEFLGSLE
ncbi:hypothetical protein GJU40_00870 [Bacillus lacus]|uniref:Uncharacterized protein n=1 Tax=Metabacillus lacus TaxID=1983721 RepID=A0A7X2IVU5_9BACI|nr:hypothetical protein [Metabacillus lacus]MRX70721.1 hypothetical protein [Metabacillus lacus]